MASFHPLVSGELTIDPKQQAAGGQIDLFWRGRSIDRHPARTVVPYVTDVLAAAKAEQAPVHLHFETIDHMNSSTITAIIQIIREAKEHATPMVLVFDSSKPWQKLSFEALAVFATGDGLLRIVGRPAS